MFTFLLVVHAVIAAALVAVILMQRSEGGGLGMGGSPTGLMSARGAADFLTRATTILASLFVLMSVGLAVLASVQHGPRAIDTSLARPGGSAGGLAPAAPAAADGVPLAGDPLAGVAAAAGNGTAPPAATLAPTTQRARRSRDGETETTESAGSDAANASAPPPAAVPEAAPAPAASAPAPAPAPAAPEPAAAPAPQPPANSSPGTTNANSAAPPSQ